VQKTKKAENRKEKTRAYLQKKDLPTPTKRKKGKKTKKESLRGAKGCGKGGLGKARGENKTMRPTKGEFPTDGKKEMVGGGGEPNSTFVEKRRGVTKGTSKKSLT